MNDFLRESTVHISLTISKKLGVYLEECDVINAGTVGAKCHPGTEAKNFAPQPRLRRIVMRLRPAFRDNLLKLSRVRRGFNIKGFDRPDP